MPLTLHAALIPTYQQLLGSLGGLIDKAEIWCGENGCDEAAFIGKKLSDDMLPFGYQVQSCWVHSAHAIGRCGVGTFMPVRDPWPETFQGLRDVVARAQKGLAETDEAMLEALADKELVFTIGDAFRKEFTVQDFLLSFSQPNFFFHVTAAYAIMRAQGIAIGKRDYLGAYRTKG